MAPEKIIIDTDPGIDDILGLLLAFSTTPEEVEVLLVSITFGNVELHDCLLNVAALFHIIAKEQEWRRSRGQPDGFDTLKTSRPIVAVGAEEPLADQLMVADFYHGKDGLGNIHSTHPHLSPSDTWKTLFDAPPSMPKPAGDLKPADIKHSTQEHTSFTPSKLPAHKEILRLLKENAKETITIIAIGPLTNLALAAAEDPETFLKTKEVIVMGGAIDVPGNVLPLSEFNFCADAFAAARVLALTSPNPSTTMPPIPPSSSAVLLDYPKKLSRSLNLTLLPLDVTTEHRLTPEVFRQWSATPLANGSPLAEWTSAFLAKTFEKAEDEGGGGRGLSLHDPLAVWYGIKHHSFSPLSNSNPKSNGWTTKKDQDIRTETAGQWTRGACITDKRGRTRKEKAEDIDISTPVSGDAGGWGSEQRGNRVVVLTGTPFVVGREGEGEGEFGEVLCGRLFGGS